MPTTYRSDIARAMYIGTKEVFLKTLKKNRTEEWKGLCTVKQSDKMEESYDSVGNLKPASEKAEGDPLTYGKIQEAHVTVIKNKTWANGFSVTMEAKEDEKWGVVPVAKTEELARTMMQLRERKVAEVWDNVTSTIGADGVALASKNHPLLNHAGVNDNLIEKEFNIDTYEEGYQRFYNWRNHAGEKFDTLPTKMIAHRNREVEVAAMLESHLRPLMENSAIKNTTYRLRPVFNRYINELAVHLVDDNIDSVILQRRKGLTPEYDYDKRETFNFYFNVHERYETGAINPGFGFVTIKGAPSGT